MISMGEYTSAGGRSANEDSTGSFSLGGRQCVVVADGLGGHGGGKTASQTAVDLILDAFADCGGADRQWVQRLYEDVNQAVLGKQTASCPMKTTCVSLFIERDRAVWAHLGDSRLYHFVDGRLASCTMDHSVSQMAVLSGEITRGEIRFHEDRNRVLRAMGADEAVKPDIEEIEHLGENFHAFLLCSDGFWEYVLEGEMEIDLAKTDDPGEWIRYMRERLEKRVDGNHDNYTAAAVFYGLKGDKGR